MLAVVTTDALVVLDPKKTSTCPPPSCTLTSPTAASWTPDNSALLIAHSCGIQKFDVQGILQSTVYVPSESTPAVACKDKGHTVIFSAGNEVSFVDTSSGKVAHKLDTHKSPISSLAISTDGTLLATFTPEGVQTHNLSLNTTTTLRGLPLNAGSVTACVFHPHMRTRLLLGIGNLLAIYETTRPSGPSKVVAMDEKNTGDIIAITSSPFSKTLVAVGFSGGAVALVDLDKDKG